jgi:hypothetical protein
VSKRASCSHNFEEALSVMYEKKISFMFRLLQLLTFLVILPTLLVCPFSRALSEETKLQIQELNGFLAGGAE